MDGHRIAARLKLQPIDTNHHFVGRIHWPYIVLTKDIVRIALRLVALIYCHFIADQKWWIGDS
jgi:hypothetical protein